MNQYFESHVSLILIIAEIRSYIKDFMTPNCPYSPMFSPYATNGTAISTAAPPSGASPFRYGKTLVYVV